LRADREAEPLEVEVSSMVVWVIEGLAGCSAPQRSSSVGCRTVDILVSIRLARYTLIWKQIIGTELKNTHSY
jgi:hypothetical protein